MMTNSNNALIKDAIWTLFGLLRGRLSAPQIVCYVNGLIFSQWFARHEIAQVEETLNNRNYEEVGQFGLPESFALCKRIGYWNRPSIDDLKEFFNHLENEYPNELSEVFKIIQVEAKLDSTSDDYLDLFEDTGRIAMQALDSSQDELYLDVFDELLSYSANLLASGYNALNFSTPDTICDLIAGLVDAQSGDSIYDPCMGSGNLLMKCVTASNAQSIDIYGYENNQIGWVLAKINAVVHGYSSNSLLHGNILQNFSITREKKFDIVVSNPPWNIKLDAGLKEVAERFGIPRVANADYLFVSHMISSLNGPDSRMAVILPNGALSRSGVEAKIRQKLCENGLVDTVITLPERLFSNTNVAATILFLRKTSVDKETVFFIDARGMASSDRRINFFSSQAIERILQISKEKLEVPNISKLVNNSELADNRYSLYVPHYIHPKNNADLRSLDEVTFEIENLEDELLEIDIQIKEILSSIFS